MKMYDVIVFFFCKLCYRTVHYKDQHYRVKMSQISEIGNRNLLISLDYESDAFGIKNA
jgi:hypothetical protein